MITPTHYMLLSAALFMIGVIGVMVRRNIIIIFMSIELILNAVNINLVAFSNQLQNVIGQVFAIFVIAVAAAEAAVGLGIILAFYRNKETVNIDLVAFSAQLQNQVGQVFAIFVIAVAAAVLIELGAIASYSSSVPARPIVARTALPVTGNTEQVGWLLYTSYLIPFEIASMLLLVAMIGAIVLAKREL